MKTTARSLAGLLAVACSLVATLVFAQQGPGVVSAPAGATSLAPAHDASPEARLRQMEDLLTRARQAMSENHLDVAEQLIVRAESLGVAPSPLNLLADTPAKVRRELDQRRTPRGGNPTAPGQLFGGHPFSRAASPSPDPFAQQAPASGSTIQMAGGAPIQSLPSIGPTASAPAGYASASAGYASVSAGPSNVAQIPPVDPAIRAASDRLLFSARRALAMGDVRRATEFVRQAQSYQVGYGPREDSPQLVQAAIAKYEDLMMNQSQRRHTEAYRWQFARIMMEQAEAMLNWGDMDEAERLANQAKSQGLNYGPLDASPDTLLTRIANSRRQGLAREAGAGVVQASASDVIPATGVMNPNPQASLAVYDGNQDPTRTVQAANLTPAPPRPLEIAQSLPTRAPVEMPSVSGNSATALFQQGEAALRARNVNQALNFYRQAAQYGDQLDPATQQRLQDRLQMLTTPAPAAAPATTPSLANDAVAAQQLLARQVNSDVSHQERRAAGLRESDPKAALTILEQTRARVEAAAGLDPAARMAILRRVDRNIAEMRQFMEDNRGRIELSQRNQQTREDIERDQQFKLEVQKKLADLVAEHNQLLEEQRFAEAEVVAKRAIELDPNNVVAQQLAITSKLIHRVQNIREIADAKERGFIAATESVDVSAVPFNDREPMIFPEARTWQEICRNRAQLLAEQRHRRTEREIEIEQKLKTPVSLQFQNAPLATVLDHLAQLAEVNLYLDPQGLQEEGITSNASVTISLREEIPLKSALELILKNHHLGYVIENDVLKITSEQHRAGVVYTKSYPVADLVVPIPNFVPNPRMGMSGAYNEAMGRAGFNNNSSFGGAAPMGVLASADSSESATINSAVLAQMAPSAGGTAGPGASIGQGPGGLGGSAYADFDTLIDLITTTVHPDSWSEGGGGPGQIREYPTYLSLVITQTEEVHEEIIELLEQLRRLQDLQVTIEVRFITLNDNFFERIGVDFDFNIDDDIDRPYQLFGRVLEEDDDDDDDDDENGGEPARDLTDQDHDRSVTVGMTAPGVFSADLDIPFTQNSYGLAVPQFGGFDATAGASLGFAILSDIEAFFFINAAQGDRRTNILQAPKVTLFDGQTASVMDVSQSPFVMGLIPVVGDFAAAQQPVIVILSEGTFLSVQAVVSPDRRFVRLTVVPFFSQIGDVDTFTFSGATTTTSDTSTEGNQTAPDDSSSANNIQTRTSEGVSVQLPTYSFVSVSTTVSVPDGGTVLLGGIKRLNEGRTEAGVPILSKIPYVSRLFKNVGIGRETQSLMMMVTPRIIIQREEEERMGTASATTP